MSAVPHMSGRKVPLFGSKLPVAERSVNSTELTLYRLDREFVVDVEYDLTGRITNVRSDIDLTRYDWDEIDQSAAELSAEIEAECRSMERASVQKQRIAA